MIKNVLSIAGSDPSGGAGIQADLKTFSALGCYGMAAVTALTAQNTQGVSAVYELSPAFVAKQIETIFDDIRVDAVKIGMAGSAKAIRAIAKTLRGRKIPIVLDPVMVAQSGDRLISDEAVAAMKKYLFPLAAVATPNIPEAGVLAKGALTRPRLRLGLLLPNGERVGMKGRDIAREILKFGPRVVLLKGGHGGGENSDDIYADKKKTVILKGRRIKTKNNHGTGCTLSSAIACYMAQGISAEDACRAAKKYISGALKASGALKVGRGHGPVHHFHQLWKRGLIS